MLVLAAQLLAIVSAVGISVLYIHRALWSGADARLHARMVELQALVDQNDQDPTRLDFDAGQLKVPGEDFFYIEDAQGHPVAGDNAWFKPFFGELPAAGKTLRRSLNGRPYRVAVLWHAEILDQENNGVPRPRMNLFYAMAVDETQHQIDHASRLAALAGLFSALLSALLSGWAVGRGMRPLIGFARYADRIEMDRAPAAMPRDVAGHSELFPLARALNALEGRVRQALLRERQFLGDAAHELKTAVAIEKSTLQLLEQHQPSIEEYRHGIQQALEDTQRIERLVRDMLLLSSLEHSRHAPAHIATTVNLNDTIAAALEQLSPIAQLRSVVCDFDVGDPVQFRAKESDLIVLWTNLIENAICHSHPGASVRIELLPAGNSVKIIIRDTGSGIEAADLPHLFERFYRSDRSRSRLTGGFGLGLSIAKAIVENYNGSIQVASLPGQGTSVEVTFPAARG